MVKVIFVYLSEVQRSAQVLNYYITMEKQMTTPNDFESHDDEEDEESNCILTNVQKITFTLVCLPC